MQRPKLPEKKLNETKRNADPLGLGVGEFYSRLVTGMLTKAAPGEGNGPSTPEGGGSRPVPTFAALQPWLYKIKDPALACTTAQRVAAGMTRYVGGGW